MSKIFLNYAKYLSPLAIGQKVNKNGHSIHKVLFNVSFCGLFTHSRVPNMWRIGGKKKLKLFEWRQAEWNLCFVYFQTLFIFYIFSGRMYWKGFQSLEWGSGQRRQQMTKKKVEIHEINNTWRDDNNSNFEQKKTRKYCSNKFYTIPKPIDYSPSAFLLTRIIRRHARVQITWHVCESCDF